MLTYFALMVSAMGGACVMQGVHHAIATHAERQRRASEGMVLVESLVASIAIGHWKMQEKPGVTVSLALSYLARPGAQPEVIATIDIWRDDFQERSYAIIDRGGLKTRIDGVGADMLWRAVTRHNHARLLEAVAIRDGILMLDG